MAAKATDLLKKKTRGEMSIRILCDLKQYQELMDDTAAFRAFLDIQVKKYPELFPSAITDGYVLDGKTRQSSKLDGLQFRRITIKSTNEKYTVYPGCVMPYMKGYTEEVCQALRLRKYGVPFDVIVELFGHNEMYWQRMIQGFGNCSIVGTTVKKKQNSIRFIS